MEFVVTGGRGFIGSHFVEKALEEGHRVVDFDCMSYCSIQRRIAIRHSRKLQAHQDGYLRYFASTVL
jgi:nucleoside-diphosphate-sugar epimerase